MKNRSLKKRLQLLAVRNARKVNPLRADPSRTLTLRRQMVKELRKQFARLRFAVRNLLVKEDAFGLSAKLAANAFCATGVGGGVDASCSPEGSSGGSIASKLGRWIKAKAAAKFAQFEQRYGRKAAIAVMVGMAACTPVPIPGTSFVPIGIAEAVRGIGKLFTRNADAHANLVEDGLGYLREMWEEASEELPAEVEERFRSKVAEALKTGAATENTRYAFASSPDQIELFQAWLQQQFDANLTGATQEQLWKRYTEAGFRKGAARSFDDTRRAQRTAAEIAHGTEALDFYNGTRDEFLRSSFARPVAVEKVKLLAGRAFDDLENVTSDMSARMSRSLTDGLVQGKSPIEIARDMDEDIDIGRQRAELIARTEIVRVNASGQLNAMRDLGVEEVGVSVEFSASGLASMCEDCEALNGVVLTLDEAEGVIPVHPGCMCCFVPSGLSEDDSDQKDTKGAIDKAFAFAGIDVSVSSDRPRSIFNEADAAMDEFSEFLTNAFCPTGDGGGVDPGCSPSRKAPTAKEAYSSFLNHYEDGGIAKAMEYFRTLPFKNGAALIGKLPEKMKEEIAGAAPAGKPKAKLPDDPKEFGKDVQEIAAQVKTGGLGDTKVLISHVYQKAKEKYPDLTLADFKSKLIEAAQQGHVKLTRADLSDTIDLKDIKESHTPYLTDDFHLIETPPVKREQSTNPDRFRGSDKPLSEAKGIGSTRTANAFCPTGAGGGVDPSCSPVPHSGYEKVTSAVKGTDLKVVHGEGTSAPFRHHVHQVLEAIPAPVLNAFASFGGRINAGRTVTEAAPILKGETPRGWPPGMTWDAADGYYGLKEAAVAEHTVRDGVSLPSSRTGGVLRHELGHGVDAMLGTFSTHPDFRAAHAEDVKDIGRKKGFDYFKQSGNAGLSETFAEVFASMHGGGANTTRNMAEHFPKVAKVIKERLAKL